MTKVLFLLAAATFAAEAQVSVSGVTVDHLGHSTGLVHFSAAGTMTPDTGGDGRNVYWNFLKICSSTTPGTCAGGGGTMLPTGYPNAQSAPLRAGSAFTAIVTGLPPATATVEVCPMVSQDRTTWAISCSTITTPAQPSPHPVSAELPRNVSIPVVPTDYTGFHSGASTGQTTPGAITSCANLQSDMNSAQGNQASYGTVITLAAGQANKCADRYYFGQNPPDVHSFGAAQVSTVNNTIDVTGMGMGLTEGHGVQFSQNYSSLPGEFGTDPLNCGGIKPGQVYYAHFTNFGSDPNHVQLTCEYPYPKGAVMTLPDTGGGSNMYIASYPRRKDQGGALYPIVLRTATPDSQLPPPGTRMNPAFSSKLAVLQPDARCAGSVCYYAPAGGNRRAFAIAFGDNFDDGDYKMAANISLIGLEIQSIAITTTDDSSFDPMPTWNLITFKQGTSDNTIDRCYIHGQYPFPNRLATGLMWEGHNNAVTNSYFDRIVYPFHGSGSADAAYQTEGTQFMQAGTGPGPYIFYNNFFQSTGNGMHFNGGGDGGVTNTYAQDILIQRNTYTQNPPGNPQGYCSGNPGSDGWVYRNRQPLEFKGGWRAQMDGNIFEYDCHLIASAAVALTSVAGGIFDVTFTNNTWRHVSAGTMGGSSTQGGSATPSTPTSRYTYKNNLFWDIDGCKYIDHQSNAYGSGHGFCWNGYAVQTVQDGEDFIWDHNTVASLSGYVPDQFYLASGGLEGFRFTNSIFYAHSDAGTAGTGYGTRVDGGMNQDFAAGGACNGYNAEALLACSWKYPNSTVSGNLVISDSLTSAQVTSAWPTQKQPCDSAGNNCDPTNLNLVGWTQRDYTKPTQDFRLRADSPYVSGGPRPASDKYDMGADMIALEKAQGQVYFTSVVPASTAATVNFVAPDSQSCPVDVSSTDSTLVNAFTRTSDAGAAAGPRAVSLTGLTPRTDYYFRINCAVQQPTGTFHTN